MEIGFQWSEKSKDQENEQMAHVRQILKIANFGVNI
jgi:hypothetical protein